MNIKTSISLPDTLLKEIDEMVDYPDSRETIIEEALRDYIERNKKAVRVQSDLELIDNSADELNEEALDVLSYQDGTRYY
jgi:metal-responsive CopG/Arc/MetJ family transcriptional regulator